MKIIPAILAFSSSDFDYQMERLSFASEIQIDIMDGVLVENTTIQLSDIMILSPHIVFEAHLMVADPEKLIPDIMRLGISRVAIHIESGGDLAHIIERFHHRGVKVFLAINPATDLNQIRAYLPVIDGVLVMTVVPGYGSQEMISDALTKVGMIKADYPQMIVEVDGGVKMHNLSEVVDAGADYAIVGSAIVKSDDPKSTYQQMNLAAGFSG